ncbi:MAG: hypothetical protein AAF629_02375 [Chloroflexota bacterium]
MTKSITIKSLLAIVSVSIILIWFQAQPALAGWAIRDGTAVNGVRVCRDGMYLGVGSQIGPGPVTVRAELQPGGDILFDKSYTLSENPVEEAFLTHSDFFFEMWDVAFSPLPVGSEVILAGGSTNPTVIVEACYINPSVADIDSAFTYQGYLADGDDAANGRYDFRFLLYSAATNGDQVGTTVTHNDLVVTDGLFTTDLAFGDHIFNGGNRWLEIQVRAGSSTGSYTTLSPRQQITAAPYAQGLRPGVIISGTLPEAVMRLENVIGDALQIDEAYTGVNILRAREDGVYIGEAASDGVYVGSATRQGLHVQSAGSSGVYVGSAFHALYAGSTSDDGVYIQSAGDNGIYVGNATNDGIHIWTAGDNAIEAKNNNSNPTIIARNSLATGDSEGLVVAVNSSGGEAIEASNSSSLDTANIILACSDDPCTLAGVEFRVRRNGNVTAEGSFTGGGADYADMMAVSGDPTTYEPGDLLAIGSDGSLIKANQPNASNIVGVYSTQPAFVGDARSTAEKRPGDSIRLESDENPEALLKNGKVDNFVPVGLIGVIPTKVSAENGPIQPGDLLTSSSTPGYAMKALPLNINGVEFFAPGTIIGKALAPLDTEAGLIDVLVTLQ